VITDPDLPAFDDPAADASTPFGREGSFEAPMRGLHQMAGLGLLGDFQHQISDLQLATFTRGCDPFDEEIGPAHHPWKRDSELATGAFPPLPEEDSDLAARFSATGVAYYALGAPHLCFPYLDQGRPKGRGAGYSQQTAHIFTSIILQLVMNYTFMS